MCTFGVHDGEVCLEKVSPEPCLLRWWCLERSPVLDILAYLTWVLEQVLKSGPEAPAEMFTPAACKKAQRSGSR